MRSSSLLAVTIGTLMVSPVLASERGTTGHLSFEQRVAAQEAIERANYAHQVGATKRFEAAIPRPLLEEKVRTYLKQSAAVEKHWKTPITATMLRRERERMERGTHMPERLRELYAALDDDRFLIEECLARATLADRLTRNFLAYDERFQGAARREALELRRQLSAGVVDPLAEDSRRRTLTVHRTETPQNMNRYDSRELWLVATEFDEWAEQVATEAKSAGEVTDDRDAYRIRVVIDRDADGMRIAEFAVPKLSWDDWWRVEKGKFDESSVSAVAVPVNGDLPVSNFVEDCPVDDTWDAGSLGSIPDTGNSFAVVWTGSSMIVCGPAGSNFSGSFGLAVGRYNPETDSWEAASSGIESRRGHTAVWTGTEMLVWGGEGNAYFPLPSGGRYDPATDSWTPISTSNAPELRAWHSAVWTGTEMIVWGGYSNGGAVHTGGRYTPSTNTWSETSTGPNVPTPRTYHTAVWTGTEMIIWGGYEFDSEPVNTGGRYNPSTNTWQRTSTTAAVPEGRAIHTALWTGAKMLVWGGTATPSGGRYDPASDSWQPISTVGASGGTLAVWTGTRMIVWGDQSSARYDPVGDSWSPISVVNAPVGIGYATVVWTGSRMVVWGGFRGGQYDPATDNWTPVAGTPGRSLGHGAVWTGTEMIVGGGSYASNVARHNLVTDSWTFASTTNAPPFSGALIWTGAEMVVWGGYAGARYNPVSDTWAAISGGPNAPSPRNGSAVTWTGSELIVWGGISDSGYLNTGSRYTPANDTWSVMSTGPNVPSPRADATAVWTGDRVVIWGGSSPGVLVSGGRYDPSSNGWATMSIVGVPEIDTSAHVVWTGSALFVTPTSTGSVGGLYHPSSDSWTPTAPLPSTGGSPIGRSAIWAGSRVVIWGGYPNSSGGARYAPVNNTWEPTGVAGAPLGRDSHSAIWTGKWMIVWGGWRTEGNTLGSGSKYAVNPDDDADGITVCGGDCDDQSLGIHPGAAEQCNGADDNCNSAIDDDASGVDSDSDGVHNACDNCRFAYNADQIDSDGDFIGSACDNCIAIANASQQDLDSDQRGDPCDNCVASYNPSQDDFDQDRRGDVCDNCLFEFNPAQSDFDHDAQGDLCDMNDGLIYLYSTTDGFVEWQGETGPTSWNVYEGSLAVLQSTGVYTQASGSNPLADRHCGITTPWIADSEAVPLGAAKFALVTGVIGGVEGSLGTSSNGATRPNSNPCP